MQNKKDISLYDETYDLSNCESEPLRHIRRIQNYGSLIVADTSLEIWYQASADLISELSSSSLQSYLGDKLNDKDFCKLIQGEDGVTVSTTFNDHPYIIIKHKDNELVYLEFEKQVNSPLEIEDATIKIQNSILSISQSENLNHFLDKILEEVKKISGYDHTMIYEFDDEFNGTIIRELKTEDRPSYNGMKFPASDIPKQARDLYYKEAIRTIADVEAEQVVLEGNPNNTAPHNVDLSKVHLRGVSPIHLEYLSNIDVQASFSVAIIKKEQLWGLIVCHHTVPKIIDFNTRKWLKFLSSLISNNLNSLNRELSKRRQLEKEISSKRILQRILESKDLIQSIIFDDPNILNLIDANAIYVKSGAELVGRGDLPSTEKLAALLEWCSNQDEFDIKHYRKTKGILPDEVTDEKFAGLLIIQLSAATQDYIIFFRSEERKEIVWAGNPAKSKTFNEEKGRLSPRISFEKWIEHSKDTALQWSEDDINMAFQIKKEIREYLYRRYNELLLLNNELEQAYKSMESFSYTVSHDLKSPLRAIKGFSQILKSDYEHKLDENGLDLLHMINRNIDKMNLFIADILTFSKFNNGSMKVSKVNIKNLIGEIWEDVSFNHPKAKLMMSKELPTVYGDKSLIKQVFGNLISNSVKYVKPGLDPEIEINAKEGEIFATFSVSDNGIGIPEKSREKVFELFRRLVKEQDYEGSGIGLAIVKKAIDRHGGKISIESNSNGGTIFKIMLPTTNNFSSQ